MIECMCRVSHEPEAGKYADCLRACVASVLDYENPEHVPHFFEGTADPIIGQLRLRNFLATLGYGAFYTHYDGAMPMDNILDMMAENNPDIHYILCAANEAGNHAVVCKSNAVVHNPSWYGGAITRPNTDGYWSIMVIARL